MTEETGRAETLDEDFFADPYQTYRQWRDQGRVHRACFPDGTEGWVVTGYAEGRAALADPRLRKGAANEAFLRKIGRAPATGGSLTTHMLNSDPPDHTRLRKLVSKAFTGRRVQALRPRIEEIATALLDDMATREEADLIDAFALPLPIRVICELLGVPYADREVFQVRGQTLLDGGHDREAFVTAMRAMARYLATLVRSKREQPADDLLSALVRARDAGDHLSEQEITSMAFLLLIAGHETTVNLIANGVHALLRHPRQLDALRADASLIPAAVEEFLRYDGPVNLATLRYAAEPVVIGDTEIPAGDFVHIALISANRDPGRFDEPDRLDITRDASGHVAFGHGIHYCLGAPLARLEAEIAFSLLLRRFPRLRPAKPDQDLRWQPSVRFHALAGLPVRLR